MQRANLLGKGPSTARIGLTVYLTEPSTHTFRGTGGVGSTLEHIYGGQEGYAFGIALFIVI